MLLALNKRRLLVWGAGAMGVALLAMLLARLALVGLLVDTLLRFGGASEVTFHVTRASPWQVVVENLGFQVSAQAYSAQRVSVARAHWWTPSLGTVMIEQARVPVTLDAPAAKPAGQPSPAPWDVPVEKLSVDGQLIVRTADLPAQVLTVTLAAQRTEAGKWEAQATAKAPGLALAGQGTYRYARGEFDFKVPSATVDLKTWQAFVHRLLVLSEGPWETAGQISGSAEGRLVGKTLTATATVRLRDGELRSAKQAITATGITADLEFTDVVQAVTKPGTLQVREVRTGQLALGDVRMEFALVDRNRLNVTRASLQALGGRVATEPFALRLDQPVLDAVLLVEGIQIEQVMALTKDLPAQAQGRVNGRLPVRFDGTGLRLGTGWLALTPGVAAQIQFNASGLLTGGVAPSNPGFPVLQKIEAGLLKLRVNTLRLDIRPPDAPTGRSAQLHLEGEPLDRDVKAPVILDLNVNGPLEQLLNLGLDSRVSFGSKP